MTGKLVVLLSLGWVGHAVACSCVNDDALKLYDTSQLIVVARAGALEGDHQRVDVSQVLKGVAPKGGVVLAAQTSTCNAAMQLSAGTEYLLFLTAAPRGLQLTTRCFAPPLVNGAFALRLGEHEVTIHRSMIGEFLNTRGVLPRLELFTSFSVRDGLVETWLAIKNLEDHDVTVFAPSNRDAFAFFVLDANGNVVQPKGYAKVDPKGGELRIAAKKPPHRTFVEPLFPISVRHGAVRLRPRARSALPRASALSTLRHQLRRGLVGRTRSHALNGQALMWFSVCVQWVTNARATRLNFAVF